MTTPQTDSLFTQSIADAFIYADEIVDALQRRYTEHPCLSGKTQWSQSGLSFVFISCVMCYYWLALNKECVLLVDDYLYVFYTFDLLID